MFPIIFILLLFGFISILNSQRENIHVGVFLIIFSSAVMSIGIIFTNDAMRSYSGHKISICMNLVIQCFKMIFMILPFCCKCNQNNVVDVIE